MQVLLSLHDVAYASLLEQKQLHLTVLGGDLARVQALYAQLSIPPSEVSDPSMLELLPLSHEDQASDLSKARTLRVQAELARLQQVLAQRLDAITSALCEMSGLWSRLGFGAANIQSPDIDALLMQDPAGAGGAGSVQKAAAAAPAPLAPTPAVLAALQVRKLELDAAAENRREEIEAKKMAIAALHKRLGSAADQVEKTAAQCAAWATSPHPLSAAVIAGYDAAIAALEKTKQARMQGLVFDLRARIDAVYSELQMSAAERGAFVPFQSMVYNDAVLELHEAELARVTERRAALAPVFALVAKWRLMREEVAAFEVSSADPSRLTKRGSHLILAQEEKLRKKRDVSLPALERRLLDLVEAYAAAHPEDVVHIQGVPLRAQLETSMAARDDSKSAKKTADELARRAKKDAANLANAEAANGGKPLASSVAATPLKASASRPASASAAPTPVRASVSASSINAASNAAAVTAPIMATPARHARSALAMEASTPMSAAKPAPAPAAYMATPLKAPSASASRMQAPSSATSSAVAATTPQVVRTRIPTFSTTSTSLQTVLATPSAAPSATPSAAPTPRAPVVQEEENEDEEEDAEGDNENTVVAASTPASTPLASEQQQPRAALRPLANNNVVRKLNVPEGGLVKPAAIGIAAAPAAVAAAVPVAAPVALSLDSLDLDVAATFMLDVEARLAVCGAGSQESDSDRVQVLSQAIEHESPRPTLAQLSKLHYLRAKLWEKMAHHERAEQDMELSQKLIMQL